MQLHEIGMLVRERRKALAITQAHLARLAGLSRTTVSQLESGALKDLGFSKLGRLVAILGLGLDAKAREKHSPALKIAAQTASTSYRKVLTPDALRDILKSGVVPDNYAAHMTTLLDEAPLQLVISAIEEASLETDTPAKTVLENVANIAKTLRTYRKVW